MNDNEIENSSKLALDDSVNKLSPKLRQDLFNARQQALSAKSEPWFKRPMTGFAVAAGFSALLLVNYFPSSFLSEPSYLSEPGYLSKSQNNAVSQLAQSGLEDFMLLSTFDETDLEIAEDLEFAYWLSEHLENETTPEILSNSELRNG